LAELIHTKVYLTFITLAMKSGWTWPIIVKKSSSCKTKLWNLWVFLRVLLLHREMRFYTFT